MGCVCILQRHGCHPLAFGTEVEMGGLPLQVRQDAEIARRAEAIQRLGRDLPDFLGSEDVSGLQRASAGSMWAGEPSK